MYSSETAAEGLLRATERTRLWAWSGEPGRLPAPLEPTVWGWKRQQINRDELIIAVHDKCWEIHDATEISSVGQAPALAERPQGWNGSRGPEDGAPSASPLTLAWRDTSLRHHIIPPVNASTCVYNGKGVCKKCITTPPWSHLDMLTRISYSNSNSYSNFLRNCKRFWESVPSH